MNVAAIGRTSWLYNTIELIVKRGHKIKAIITAKSSPEYTKSEKDFKMLAKKINAPFFLTSSLNDPRTIKTIKGSDIAVSVNWVSIFTQYQIRRFKVGILNAHIGDLPKYRGNACPNWAILNGEKKVFISIHLVEADKLDCGRIIVQDTLPISDNTYIGDIYCWVENMIPDLFIKALNLLHKNPSYTLKYADVGSKKSFRCYPRIPEDNRIAWEYPAKNIHRLIRASSRPFTGAYGSIDSKKITIWKAQLYNDNEKFVAVPGQICKVEDDHFIVITGKGKLKVTEWESSVKIKNVRQRLY